MIHGATWRSGEGKAGSNQPQQRSLMATETVTQQASAVISTSQSWLKQHETIVIVALCLILGFFIVYKGSSIMASYEQHKAEQANTALAIQKSQADAALEQAKTMLADYESALNASVKENAALAAAITTRDKVTSSQQQTDAKLPPSGLATRWQGLVHDTGIQSAPSGFSVTDSAGLATVQTLELVPTLQQDLSDETKKTGNLQTDVDKANALISQGKIAVNGLQLQLVDQDKACKIQIKTVEDKARRSKLRWFGAGFITGFIGGAWTGFHL